MCQLYLDICENLIFNHTLLVQLGLPGGWVFFSFFKYSGPGFGKKKYSGLDHVWTNILASSIEKHKSALYPWK